MTIVAIFREPLLQGFHLLGQLAVLLTQLLNHDVLLPEQRLLLLDQFVTLRQLRSQRDEFFFDRHALTLLPLMLLGKSPADVSSYHKILINTTVRIYTSQFSHPYVLTRAGTAKGDCRYMYRVSR